MIISFSGLDGSGKTSAAMMLVAYCKEKNLKTEYVHLQNFSLFNKFGKILQNTAPQAHRRVEDVEFKKKSSFKKEMLAILRKITYLTDVLRFRLKTSFCKKIFVCDRYFYDLAVQSMYLQMFGKTFVRFYLKIIPQPDLAYFLDLSPATSFARSQEKDLAFHTIKFREYQRILQHYSFCIIQSKTLPQTKKAILHVFSQFYR